MMTPIQNLFWLSSIKRNKAKVIIATSDSQWEALDAMRQQLHWNRSTRFYFWYKYREYLNRPSMIGVPLSQSK